jgi:hypothetical protein
VKRTVMMIFGSMEMAPSRRCFTASSWALLSTCKLLVCLKHAARRAVPQRATVGACRQFQLGLSHGFF